MYILWNVEKCHSQTYLQGKNKDEDIEDAIVNTVEWEVADMSLETSIDIYTLLLLLSRFSHVRLCVTP